VLDSTNGILKDLTEKGGASFLVETNAMLNGTGQPQPCVFLSGPGVTDKCLTFPPERFCTQQRNEMKVDTHEISLTLNGCSPRQVGRKDSID
jgi:hypothetical protein